MVSMIFKLTPLRLRSRIWVGLERCIINVHEHSPEIASRWLERLFYTKRNVDLIIH